MLATFGGNLWIKLFWYLELLRKTWIHFSVLDFFEYLNGKGISATLLPWNRTAEEGKDFHNLTWKTYVQLEAPNCFLWLLLFTVLMSSHIKTPNSWHYSIFHMNICHMRRKHKNLEGRMMGLPFSLQNPFSALDGSLPNEKLQGQKWLAGWFSYGK